MGGNFRDDGAELWVKAFTLLWAKSKAMEEAGEEGSCSVLRIWGYDVGVRLNGVRMHSVRLFIQWFK